MAQERERLEKRKEWEMKMRNKADLLNQIQQKIKRKRELELKDKEYAKIIEQNVKKMDELEKKQKDYQKQLILKEKQIRDKQLREKLKNIKEDIEKQTSELLEEIEKN